MPDLRENNPMIRKVRQILQKDVNDDDYIIKLEKDILDSYLSYGNITGKNLHLDDSVLIVTS